MAPLKKIAAVCALLLFVGSDLARCVASSASPGGDEDQAAAGALLLLREFLELELSLLAEQHGGVGEFCPPACQNCLIICGITCVLSANPATCFVNCTTANGCFNKTLPVVA